MSDTKPQEKVFYVPLRRALVTLFLLIFFVGFGVGFAVKALATIPIINQNYECGQPYDTDWHGTIEFSNPNKKVENWTAKADKGVLDATSGSIEPWDGQSDKPSAVVAVTVPTVEGSSETDVTITIHAEWVAGGATDRTVTLYGEGPCYIPSDSPSPSDSESSPSPSDSGSSSSPSPSETSSSPSPSTSTSTTQSPSSSPSPSASTSKTASPSPDASTSQSSSTPPPKKHTSTCAETDGTDDGCLPHTGFGAGWALLCGIGLLGAGSALIGLTVRKRRLV